MQEQYISLTDLRKVSGIGDKTIERVKERVLQSEEDENYISKYDENLHLDINDIYQGDCLKLMNGIPDKSIDMILCDLPYGTTACRWDEVISFSKLWKQYHRVIKDNGVVVLTGSQPFTSNLVMSNPAMFKYEWIWEKNRGSNFATVKYMPMKEHESILVFYKNKPTYNETRIERSEGGKSRASYEIVAKNKGKRDVYDGIKSTS